MAGKKMSANFAPFSSIWKRDAYVCDANMRRENLLHKPEVPKTLFSFFSFFPVTVRAPTQRRENESEKKTVINFVNENKTKQSKASH